MSSMYVSNETVARVLAAINHGARRGYPTPMTLLMPPAKVGLRLLAMNYDALRACYEDRTAHHFGAPPTRYTWNPLPFANEMQLFKTLQFFLYQCSEGTVPSTPLYKELAAIRDWYGERVGYNPEGDTWEAARREQRKPFHTPEAKIAYDAAMWG